MRQSTSYFIQRILLCLTCFVHFAWPSASYAAVDVSWLASRANPDGSFATPDDVATPFQATAEALRTFRALGETTQPGIPAALGFINAEGFHNTENLARKIIANAEASVDVSTLLAELLAMRNADDGFGELLGFNSTPLDTAFALEALVAAGGNESNVIAGAISYLSANQNPDGGFSRNSVNASSVYITALVSGVLQRFLLFENSVEIADTASAFLFGNQVPGGGWASDWETALALLAVIPSTTDATRYAPALDALRARQLANGSWGNDVYATALALRVLHLAESIKFPVDPAGGTITGRVVDAGTGLPLAGVTVSLAQLAGSQVSTGTDGRFTLIGIPPNSYTVNYQTAGYSGASRTAAVKAGQLVHLGTVRLSPLAGVGFITGTIIDAATSQPIAGTLVRAVGASTVSATTDAAGFYRIVTDPAPVTLTASAAGFNSVSGTGTVVAGATLIFSPALFSTGTAPPGQNVTIRGNVVDADTQEPLADVGVAISGTGVSTTSDPAGAFSLSNITAGELTVNLSKTGHQSVSLSVVAPPGATINLGTINLPRIDGLITTTIFGTVVDADTGQAIAGATVTVDAGGLSATTAADGTYRIQGITALNFNLSTSASGYLSATTSISLVEPAVLRVDIALTSASVGGISITSLSTDQASYPALSPVTISATLANNSPVARSLQPFVVIIDSSDNLVERFPATGATAGIPEPVVLGPGTSLDITAMWDTDRNAPGSYRIILQAFDASSNQLLAERATEIGIQVTETIASVTLVATPRFTNVGATEQIAFNASVVNRSNVTVNVTIFYTWRSPSGDVLRTGETTVTLQPTETQKLATVDSFTFTFAQSGEHPLEVQVLSTPTPGTVVGDVIVAAPSVRIEPSQTITPSTVVPDGDKRIKLNIQLKGVEQ